MNYPPWACGPTPLRSKGAPAAAGQSPFRAGCWVWPFHARRGSETEMTFVGRG